MLLLLLLFVAPNVASNTNSHPYDSALKILHQNSIQLSDLTHLDAHDLRALDLNVQQRLALRRQMDELQDFTFVVSHFNSSRQWGKCLNIVIKYRYVPVPVGKLNSTYLDYREMRDMAIKLAQPTPELPINVQWELINQNLVEQIMTRYSTRLTAVSSLIQVKNELNIHIQEPGNHGSIITRGDITPTNEPWINNFQYDCTKQTGPTAV